MQKPTSSFFNFKATESERETSNDFQARVGALDNFEAHYSFFANEIDEQEQSYDFEARFNPTDEMCAYYNFSVKVIEHDTRYDFYAKYEVLPMVIDYDDEMAVMVVREATLERHSSMNATSKTAGIERKQAFEMNNDRAAAVDDTGLLNRRKEVAVELNRADKVTPLAEQLDTHFEVNQSFESEINHEAVVNESQSVFVPIEKKAIIDKTERVAKRIERTLSIDYIELFNKLIELSVEINASETVTSIRNYISDIEATSGMASRAERELTVGNLERLKRKEERFVDVHEGAKMERMKEASTEIESTVYIKFGAVDTDIENSVKSEIVNECQTAIEFAEHLEEVQERLTVIEMSEQLEGVREQPAMIKRCGVLSRRLDHAAEITEFTTLSVGVRKVTKIEKVSAVSSCTRVSTDIERSEKAEHLQVSFAEVENNSKASVNADKLAVVEHAIEAYESAEFTAVFDTSMNSAAHASFSADVEVGGKSEIITITTCENISTTQEANTLLSLNTFLSTTGTMSRDERLTTVVEHLDEFKRLGTHNTEAESTIGIKLSTINAEIEEESRISDADDIHVSIEQSTSSDSASITEIEVENFFEADIEQPINSIRLDTPHVTSIEEALLQEKIKIVLNAAIEEQFISDVLGEHLAEIEDVIIGHFPEVHDEEEQKKLVWLIMGRPSWLHRYWQRTTR